MDELNQASDVMSKRSSASNYLGASASRGEAETPMHGNAWAGAHKVMRRLIRRGHSPNVRDDTGETPLHGAASHGHATVVRLLLRSGADPNIAAFDTGLTPLHWASGWGGLSVVRALLQGGADIHAKDHRGHTPYETAMRHGQIQIAAWIRKRGG